MDTDMALRVFCDLMNEKAWQLGAKNTRFTGPTATTMTAITPPPGFVLIARAALGDVLRQVAATTMPLAGATLAEYQPPAAPGLRRNITRGPRDLRRNYPKPVAAWSPLPGRQAGMLGIVLNSTRAEVWKDTRNLLEYGFNSWKQYHGGGGQAIPSLSGGKGWASPAWSGLWRGTYSDLLNVEDIARLKLDFVWAEGVRKEDEAGLVLQAPIREGQVLGQALVTLEGEVLAEIEMIAAYGIKGGGWLSAGKLLLALALFAAVLFAILLRAFRTAGDSAAVRK